MSILAAIPCLFLGISVLVQWFDGLAAFTVSKPSPTWVFLYLWRLTPLCSSFGLKKALQKEKFIGLVRLLSLQTPCIYAPKTIITLFCPFPYRRVFRRSFSFGSQQAYRLFGDRENG